jgi:hypothetical protein
MANLSRRENARCFLEGLSTDELQYIAAFLGACVLEPMVGDPDASRDCLARLITQYEWNRRPYRMSRLSNSPDSQRDTDTDVAHKMILLLEYLSMNRTLGEPAAWAVESGTA